MIPDDSHFKVDLTIEGSDFKSTKKSTSSFILQNATVASFSTYASNSHLFPVDSMHFVMSSSSDQQWIKRLILTSVTSQLTLIKFYSLCKHRLKFLLWQQHIKKRDSNYHFLCISKFLCLCSSFRLLSCSVNFCAKVTTDKMIHCVDWN